MILPLQRSYSSFTFTNFFAKISVRSDQEKIANFFKTFIAEKPGDVSSKFESWEQFWTASTRQLREMGLSVRNRKLVLNARERLRHLAASKTTADAWVKTVQQNKFEAAVKAAGPTAL